MGFSPSGKVIEPIAAESSHAHPSGPAAIRAPASEGVRLHAEPGGGLLGGQEGRRGGGASALSGCLFHAPIKRKGADEI